MTTSLLFCFLFYNVLLYIYKKVAYERERERERDLILIKHIYLNFDIIFYLNLFFLPFEMQNY